MTTKKHAQNIGDNFVHQLFGFSGQCFGLGHSHAYLSG
jgi:hypothetical protein